jgi:drug/metabolite transporter (DMT)-like permease
VVPKPTATVGNALALAAAVFFVATDYFSALLSRRVDSSAVALFAQLGGTVLILVAAVVVPAPSVGVEALAWGALSGVGTGIGVTFLFRGMGNGQLSVVVPLSAVNGVALPVMVGVLLLGERPSPLSWLGIAVTAPALWLVSHTRPASGPAAAPPPAASTDWSPASGSRCSSSHWSPSTLRPGSGRSSRAGSPRWWRSFPWSS